MKVIVFRPQFNNAASVAGRTVEKFYLGLKKLGLDVTAFVQVTMAKQPDSTTEAFHSAVRDEPKITECHAMSGSQDYLMKVVARTMDDFSELCMQRILKFPGVQHVESSFSLKEIKNSRVLPA